MLFASGWHGWSETGSGQGLRQDNTLGLSGEPPYSVGQNTANDNNANYRYPSLDQSIADTYAKRSTATNKNSLYDSYIRAFRWATDRLGPKGVVAFVSNGGWIDGNTADGMRLALADEYSTIYVYNLRGNARTAGEVRRKEKDNVFGQGARTTVAIFIGVKNPTHTGPCRIQYHDIGDYLTREQKLHRVAQAQLDNIPWQSITPNTHGDWANQRDDTFSIFTAITEIFASTSAGVQTNRDAWCYNSSSNAVEANMLRMISTYNEQARRAGEPDVRFQDNPREVSWSSSLKPRALRGEIHKYDPGAVRAALYRPFSPQHAYFDPIFNHRPGQHSRYFPTAHTPNVGFYALAPGSPKPFSVLGTDRLPDLAMYGSNSGQFYPRWTYVPGAKRVESDMLFDPDHEVIDGYQRIDNITDAALASYRHTFGTWVTKDDIFAYVYGVLHSPQYRQRFAADLKKMLPRVPLAASLEDFRAFVDAGAALMTLHIGYETVEPYPLEELVSPGVDLDEYELFAVGAKMKFQGSGKSVDKSTLIYNSHVTLRGIPDEAHRYQLGSRSALEWIIDRYWVRTDKASGIVNDPNAWSCEHGNPRYIIDLVKRVVTVSVETTKIVDSLPDLILED